jgi:hypothetical protein
VQPRFLVNLSPYKLPKPCTRSLNPARRFPGDTSISVMAHDYDGGSLHEGVLLVDCPNILAGLRIAHSCDICNFNRPRVATSTGSKLFTGWEKSTRTTCRGHPSLCGSENRIRRGLELVPLNYFFSSFNQITLLH